MKKEKDIEELRQDYQKQYNFYYQIVEEYVSKYGDDNCDYLRHKRALMFYNKGALAAINKLMGV